MKGSLVFSAEGRMNTKRRRILENKKQSNVSKAPETYRTNTTKEELCYEYITLFSQQFSEIHTHRRPLFMAADNEYGIKKFLPTAIRPTQIPFQELYDLHECAAYFSSYVQYEPLDPPFEPPFAVFSPSKTLSSFTGDSFDMSTLLVSFLLGAGYDAYIVYGYAPKYIAHKDQSMTLCPMISGPKEIPKVLMMISDDSMNHTEELPTTYKVIDNKVRDSQYLKQEIDKQILASQDTFQLWQSSSAPETNDPSIENHSKNQDKPYVHAWIYIAAGKRDMKESHYLETTTGRLYSMKNSPYSGIEAIWNNTNYWINLNLSTKVSEVSIIRSIH